MITHCQITDTSTVTVNGPSGSASIAGPLEFDCHSITVGGTTYTGGVLVASGSVLQLLEYTPRMMDLHDPLLAFAFLLGLICARFRI